VIKAAAETAAARRWTDLREQSYRRDTASTRLRRLKQERWSKTLKSVPGR